MIVPDANLLVYAFDDRSPFHDAARYWWEDLLNGAERVGMPSLTVAAFVRLATHPKVLVSPLAPARALDYVEEWFELSHVIPINPGRDHLVLFRRNLEAAGVGGNLVTDAYLAALAMEHQAELHSNDTDFSRFPGLRWHNPL